MMQITFRSYTDRRSTGRIWSVKLKLGEKWLHIETNGERLR